MDDALLTRARALREAGDWLGLAALGDGLDAEALDAAPELAYHHAGALWRTGRTARALEVAEEAERGARRRGDARLAASAANLAGNVLFELGRMEDAEARFGALLEEATALGDEELAANACNNLGVLANVRGRRDRALAWYGRALAAYRRLGLARGMAQAHHNLGISYRDLGFDREADAHWARAVELGVESGTEDVVALAEADRGMLRARAGDGALAARFAGRALARFEALGDPLGRGEALRVLAAAARASGSDGEAAERLEEALLLAREHADPLLRAEVQRDRGLLLRDRGDADAALAALEDAADAFAGVGASAEAEAVRTIAAGLGEG